MATIDNNIQFDIANKQILIDDLSSGVTLANCNANMKIIAPDGTTFYDNTNFNKIYVAEAIGATAPTTTSVMLGSSAGTNDYTGGIIYLFAGTGAGQTRKITNYNTFTKIATVPTWDITPVVGSTTYRATAADIFVPLDNPVTTGTATAGTATTISLQSSSTLIYTQWYITITGGTGAGQKRLISSQTGLVATVPTWAITPDGTSVYALSRPAVIGCPLDGYGNIQTGLYSFTETLYDGTTYYTNTKTYTYNFVEPTVDLTISIDCFSPLFKMTDATNYVVNNINPTTVVTLTIYPPAQLNLPSTTGGGTGQGFSISRSAGLYSGINTFDLKAESIYSMATGITIWDYIEDTVPENVTCDYQLCDLYCCVKSLWNRYQDQLQNNRVDAQTSYYQLQQVSAIMTLIRQAYECGKSDDVSAYVSQILKISNCTPGCGCTDNTTPVAIVGLGAASQLINVTSGNTNVLTVTPTVTGNTTTFVINLVQSLVNTILNLFGTNITGLVNITTNSPSIVAGVKTYTLTGATVSPTDSSVTITKTPGSGIVTDYAIQANPKNVLVDDFVSTAATTAGQYNSIPAKKFTIPFGALVTAGDKLVFRQRITSDLTLVSTSNKIQTLLNSTTLITNYPMAKMSSVELTYNVVRISNVLVAVTLKIENFSGGIVSQGNFNALLGTAFTVNDLDNNTSINTFETQMWRTVNGAMAYTYQQVDVFKI